MTNPLTTALVEGLQENDVPFGVFDEHQTDLGAKLVAVRGNTGVVFYLEDGHELASIALTHAQVESLVWVLTNNTQEKE